IVGDCCEVEGACRQARRSRRTESPWAAPGERKVTRYKSWKRSLDVTEVRHQHVRGERSEVIEKINIVRGRCPGDRIRAQPHPFHNDLADKRKINIVADGGVRVAHEGDFDKSVRAKDVHIYIRRSSGQGQDLEQKAAARRVD